MKEAIVYKKKGAINWAELPALPIDNLLLVESTQVKARAQICYDEENLYLHFTAWEQEIRVEEEGLLGMPCWDSCMEFFFIPNMDEPEYINLEMNPAAITLTAKGAERGSRPRLDIHGENVKVESLIKGEEGWTVMAFISYDFLLKHYSHCDKNMRANFYKCGDKTVRKHYSTWNPVETPAPDYHRPEYFGKLVLSDESI